MKRLLYILTLAFILSGCKKYRLEDGKLYYHSWSPINGYSILSNEMPSSPPILDVGIMHELDSFIEGGTWHDTTMVTIWFDSTKTGQFVKMSRLELPRVTREEKAEIESQYGDCPFLFTDDDYYGYTTLTRNDTVLVVLVFKGFKRQRRWEHIPSSLVDCSRLIPMDSLLWRPRNFFVPEGAFYDPVVKRYRIEILQSLGLDNGIKDSVVITFDGEEGLEFVN